MKNAITLFSSKLILSVVFLLFFVSIGISQELKIYELFDNDSQVSTVSQSNKSSKVAKTSVAGSTYTQDLNNFYDLNYNLKPTIYVENNVIIQVPDNNMPIKIKLEDTKSLNILKTNNPIFQTVELIVINIQNPNEFNNAFDVSLLKSFTNLKYIYIMCNEFSSSIDQIQRFVLNPGADITVFFMRTNPS